MNSKVKISQTRRGLVCIENKHGWLNLNLSLASLSWPLYIGGQVSMVRSGLIQVTMFVYDIISYLIISMLRTP
jgi:hypothetical protein